MEHDDSVEIHVTLDKNLIVKQIEMRAEGTHNPPLARRPRIDLGETSGENPSDGLVRPLRELAQLVTETSSKVREPKTYNEVVKNPINRNKWQEAIDKELWNLDTHQTWCYIPLLDN